MGRELLEEGAPYGEQAELLPLVGAGNTRIGGLQPRKKIIPVTRIECGLKLPADGFQAFAQAPFPFPRHVCVGAEQTLRIHGERAVTAARAAVVPGYPKDCFDFVVRFIDMSYGPRWIPPRMPGRNLTLCEGEKNA